MAIGRVLTGLTQIHPTKEDIVKLENISIEKIETIEMFGIVADLLMAQVLMITVLQIVAIEYIPHQIPVGLVM
jgi:hypothetical protein